MEPEQIGSGRQFQEGEQRFGDRADEEGFSDQSSTASEPWSLRGGEPRGSLHNRAGHPSGRKARGRRQGVLATARCKDRVQAPDAFLILALDRQKQRARAVVPGPRQRQVMHPRPTHLWSGVYTHILCNATKSCDARSIFLNALGAQFLGCTRWTGRRKVRRPERRSPPLRMHGACRRGASVLRPES